MNAPSLVLASGSPRRAELLNQLGLDFTVVATEADEVAFSEELTPAEIVVHNARAKARTVVVSADQTVIAADTIVVIGNKILGKPVDAVDATRMLRLLSGRTHAVVTAICLRSGERETVEVVETLVTFAELTDELIVSYVATGEPLDKAGAYGIQGRGAVLVERIEGDYFNVVGLPLSRLAQMLRELDVEISDYW